MGENDKKWCAHCSQWLRNIKGSAKQIVDGKRTELTLWEDHDNKYHGTPKWSKAAVENASSTASTSDPTSNNSNGAAVAPSPGRVPRVKCTEYNHKYVGMSYHEWVRTYKNDKGVVTGEVTREVDVLVCTFCMKCLPALNAKRTLEWVEHPTEKQCDAAGRAHVAKVAKNSYRAGCESLRFWCVKCGFAKTAKIYRPAPNDEDAVDNDDAEEEEQGDDCEQDTTPSEQQHEEDEEDAEEDNEDDDTSSSDDATELQLPEDGTTEEQWVAVCGVLAARARIKGDQCRLDAIEKMRIDGHKKIFDAKHPHVVRAKRSRAMMMEEENDDVATTAAAENGATPTLLVVE